MARLDLTDSRLVTFGNFPCRLRRLHSGDEWLLQQFFHSHSPETVRLRYGYTITQMSDERAHRLVALDENREIAFGIFSSERGAEMLHAVARYCVEGDHVAEIAFVVRESMRRLGMAKTLLLELALAAQRHDISLLRAQVLRENHSMRLFMIRFNPTMREDADSNSLDYLAKVETVIRVLRDAA